MKKALSFILALALLLTAVLPGMTIPVAAATYVTVNDGDVIQDNFTKADTSAYYQLTATESKYYTFGFENQSVEMRTGISIADKFLNLFLGKVDIQVKDVHDKILSQFSVRCGYVGSTSLKLTEGETYYIRVTSSIAGNYRMTVGSTVDMGGDSWQTATEIASVGQLTSAIDASGDQDWFFFNTDSTSSFYHFSFENISGNGNMHMDVYEYVEGAGDTWPLRDTFNIAPSRGYTYSKELKLQPGGKYYIRLTGPVGGYQMNVTQTMDAVGDTQDEAYKVDTDVKITTALDGSGDVDWFKFTTKDYDAYYYFDFENLSIDYGYCTYKVYDAAGNVLRDNRLYHDYELSTNVKLEPNTDYYFSFAADSSGNYSFTVTDIADKYGNDINEAGAVTMNTEIKESVGGGSDVDFFKFKTASYDAYYHFDFKNLSINYGYCTYRVYDAEGNTLRDHRMYHDYGMSTDVKLEPNTTYYFSFTAEGTGNYTATVTNIPDKYREELQGAGTIALGKKVTESIGGGGDVDFFKFKTASYNAFYSIHVDKLSIQSAYTTLWVADAAGNELAFSRLYHSYDQTISLKLEPNTVYYFSFAAESQGNYAITVTAKADPAGETKEEALGAKFNTLYTQELSAGSDQDWYKFNLVRDCNIRVRTVKESGNSKTFRLYSAIDRQLVYIDCYDQREATVILEPGTYYLQVSGNSGYYSFAVATCGSEHVSANRYTPATTSAEGIKTTYCKSCQAVIEKTTIAKIKKIVLSATTFAYNGKVRRPTVTVTDSQGNKISSKFYTLTYSNASSKAVGSYTVKVTFKGAYSGTKTYKYQIALATPTVKAANTAGGVKVSWSKVAGAKTYTLYRSVYSGGKWASWKQLKIGLTSTTYTDKSVKSGATVRYTVRGHYKTYQSSFKAGNTIRYLAQPTVKVTKVSGGLQAKWGKTAGASGYYVYRRTYSKGKWSGWKQVAKTSKLYYKDKSAKKGTYYQYTAKAYYGKYASSYKNSASIKR